MVCGVVEANAQNSDNRMNDKTVFSVFLHYRTFVCQARAVYIYVKYIYYYTISHTIDILHRYVYEPQGKKNCYTPMWWYKTLSFDAYTLTAAIWIGLFTILYFVSRSC